VAEKAERAEMVDSRCSGLTMAGLIGGTMWLAFMYGLESRSPITGLRALPWESIAGVSYASTGNWYRFKSALSAYLASHAASERNAWPR